MSPSTICFILLLITIVVLISEKVPLFAVGFALPVICYFLGFVDGTEAISKIATSTLVTTACIYVVSNAFFRVGLADAIGRKIMKVTAKSNNSQRMITLLLIGVIALLCLFLPRYGVTASFIPVVCAVAMYTGISRTKLLMLLAMTVNFAGGSTVIATIPNLFANTFLESVGLETFSFFEFAWIGVPITIVGALIYTFFGDRLLPPDRIDEKALAAARMVELESGEKPAVPRWKIVVTLIAYGLFIVGLMFEKALGVPSHIIAMGCAAIIIGGRVITAKEAVASVAWGPLTFSYGILTLALSMTNTGAAQIFGEFATMLMGSNPSPTVITAVIFVISAVLTQFMSNNAACNIMFPIGYSIAVNIGANPTAMIMAITVACSASYMTPTATPSNLLVLEPGDIRFKDYAKAGWPLMLSSLVLCLIICPLVWPYY